MSVKQIILSKRLDIFATRLPQAFVVVAEESQTVGVGPTNDSLVLVCIARDDLWRGIRRTIVRNQQFKIAEALLKHALNSACEIAGTIVHRQTYSNSGRHSELPPRLMIGNRCSTGLEYLPVLKR